RRTAACLRAPEASSGTGFPDLIPRLNRPAGARPASAFRAATTHLLPALALSVAACGGPEQEPFKPNTGQIQVLNGSGSSGQAEVFRAHLMDQGFDVIEIGNARSWNYDHTLVIARTPSEQIARDLARVLGTRRVVRL